MNPQTKEYKEAEQLQVSKAKEDFLRTQDIVTKQQFKAVEEAVKILVDNKVLFYLFPYLTCPTGEKKCWQWNSCGSFAKYNKLDKLDEETKKLLSGFNFKLLNYVINMFFYNFISQNISFEDKTDYLFKLIKYILESGKDRYEQTNK